MKMAHLINMLRIGLRHFDIEQTKNILDDWNWLVSILSMAQFV